MNKEAYVQGFNDALASLSIGVGTYDKITSLVVCSMDKRTGVVTVLAQARVLPESGAVITL